VSGFTLQLSRFTILPLAMLCFVADSQAGNPLKMCYDDVAQAPWTMPNETGLNIELLKRVEKKLGEQFVFVSRPWKRCLEEARSGLVDGVVGGADSPDRRTYSVLPMQSNGQPDPEQALYSDRYLAFLRKGSGASWNGKEFLNLKTEIIVQRGYIVIDELRKKGYGVSDLVKGPDEALRMLAANMADAAVLLGVESEERMRASALYRSRIEQARQVYSVVPLYLMVSRKSYEIDPKRIDAIWQAIRAVRATPAYRKLEASEIQRHVAQ
jgi:polar amino acid transport system substrate-binding protein